MRVAALTVVVLSCAALALAGFNVNVTKAPGFDPSFLSRVVIVMSECHEALDCRRLEREVATELTRAQPRLAVVVGDSVYSQLLGLGKERYSVDLRDQLSAAVGADALLELSAPHASPGMATRKCSGLRGSVSTERGHVDHEAVLHVTFQHALVGLVDPLDGDELDVGDDAVL